MYLKPYRLHVPQMISFRNKDTCCRCSFDKEVFTIGASEEELFVILLSITVFYTRWDQLVFIVCASKILLSYLTTNMQDLY